jgi:hypothetical protein
MQQHYPVLHVMSVSPPVEPPPTESLTVESRLSGQSAQRTLVTSPTTESSSDTSPGNIAYLPVPLRQGREAGAIISRLESILGSVVDGLADGSGIITIPYKRRSSSRRSEPRMPGDRPHTGHGHTRHTRGTIQFPGRTAQESKKFGKPMSFNSPSPFVSIS